MNNFRIDLILESIYNMFGPVWFVVSAALLLHTFLAPMMRATMVTVCVLICTQIWYPPPHYIAYFLRWVLLAMLCGRGLLFIWRTPRPPGESRAARNLAVAIGALALCSTIWGDAPEYTAYTAGSFCLGLIVTFGLLWRLADGPGVLDGFVRGATVLAFVLFAGGFLVAGVAFWTESWEYYNATHFGLQDAGGRYSGLFYNPNAAGLIGTMFLPIVVAAPRRALAGLGWMRLPTCAAIAATIYLSGSRSALIGAAMSLLILALYRFGAGAFVTILFGGVLGALFMVSSPIEDIDAGAVGHIARTKHLSTLSGRLELWQEGWDAAQGHLALGQGWGHSRVLGDVDTEAAVMNGAVNQGSNLHNAHLQLLIDVGFVGVALFWMFCLCMMGAGWRILTAPTSPDNMVGVVLFTSVLALLADTWVHGAIWSMGSPTTLAFWGLCVMTLKQADRARFAVPSPEPSVAWRPPGAAPTPA